MLSKSIGINLIFHETPSDYLTTDQLKRDLEHKYFPSRYFRSIMGKQKFLFPDGHHQKDSCNTPSYN